ncbi:TraY domain-containing protein [Trichothermofontia sp.]
MNSPKATGTPLETIVLQLPVALDAALAAQAARSGRSKSEIVTAILQAHLSLEVSKLDPDPILSTRLAALQERLVQIEHHLSYLQLDSRKPALPVTSRVMPSLAVEDDIEDEPDEVLEGFLDPDRGCF